MRVVYLETSSLLRVLFRQPPFAEIAALLEGNGRVILTSVLTLMESRRVITRAKAEGLIKEGDTQVLLGLLAELEDSWHIIELSEEIQTRGGQSFPVEPLRTLDALHLASALEFKKIYPELCVCSVDDRLCHNLEPLGLADWRSL